MTQFDWMTATPESIPKSVYSLDERDLEDDEEYSLTDSTMITYLEGRVRSLL